MPRQAKVVHLPGPGKPSRGNTFAQGATVAKVELSGIGLGTAAGVLVVGSALGLFWRARNGRFRATEPQPATATAPVTPVVDPIWASLGVSMSTPVTMVQFSSAFCAPCRTTRVLCADVVATVPGVSHIEIDAESHLDAVRAMDIWRTPTVLLLDSTGTVRKRASGAPTRAQLLAAVAELLPDPAQAPATS
jgi:hypothetical protein